MSKIFAFSMKVDQQGQDEGEEVREQLSVVCPLVLLWSDLAMSSSDAEGLSPSKSLLERI